tara:strand:- start:162 stop:2936 length:2775 start_codon:yes stop_codon:yes gene_type:complete
MTTAQNTNSSSMEASLTTNPDLFSNDSWNLLLASQDVARRWRHQELNVEHLMQILFSNKKYTHIINGLNIDRTELLDQLENFLADQPSTSGNEFFIGDALEDLLETADTCKKRWGSKLIEISHLLFALGRDQRIGEQLFNDLGLPNEKLEAKLRRLPKIAPRIAKEEVKTTSSESLAKNISLTNNNQESNYNQESSAITITKSLEPNNDGSILEIYGRDLTEAARSKELDIVIGRESEIRQLIKILSRRGKNNPVLIGPSGVGKTAIAELLAQKIISGEVPESLLGIKLIALDLGALIAGAKFRGQFEERFRSVLKEVNDPDAGVILFIDELHALISPDRANTDVASLLKPVLARGELRCIGATTPENYRKTVEKDQALNSRFQQIPIKEPSLELSLEILRGIKERYELHHGVTITDEAVITANRLSNRYISDRYLPDKAIDLIDEASAQLKIELTSKPQIIENAENDLKNIELALSSGKNNSFEEEKLILNKKDIAQQTLSNLKAQWEEELIQIKDFNDLLDQQEFIFTMIADAEETGDLEEASRLRYDQLPSLKEKLDNLEQLITQNRKAGKTILKDQVEAEDIADIVARWTGIPINKVLAGERKKLLNLEAELNERVIGQDEAIHAISSAIRRARAGMKDPRRPVGSFLFLGPTGVGKTELAKALASSLFDEEEALIRLDMSEFMERNAVARLIGAPPGYVGYEEGGQITEAIRNRAYAVLLLDEIEKAHPDVFNLLLQVLDDGRLTDSQGRTIDFRHTVIVMTSNIASRAILIRSKNHDDLSENPINNEDLEIKLTKEIEKQLAQQFRPEFLNRIDEIIRFRPLSENHLQKIVKLQLADLAQLLEEQGLGLEVDNSVIQAITKEGYEPEYGARPLRRVVRRKLENPLATLLLQEDFRNAKTIRVKHGASQSEPLLFLAED